MCAAEPTQTPAPDAEPAALRDLIGREPDNIEARLALARVLMEAGRNGVAASVLAEALKMAPARGDLHRSHGRALLGQGKTESALEALAAAIRIDPEDPEAWELRVAALLAAPLRPLTGRLSGHLLACLDRDRLDHRALVQAAAASLGMSDGYRPLLGAADGPSALDDERLAAPLLGALLKRAVIADIDFERWLGRLRRRVLEAVTAGGPARVPEPFVCALAVQSRMNGYLYPVSAAERAGLERLEAAVLALPPDEVWLRLAVLAAYRPLEAVLPDARRLALAKAGVPAPFAELWRRHVNEPLEERRIADGIPVLTPIAPGISRAVRDQYEESPYPRWTGVPRGTPRPVSAVMSALFPHLSAHPPALPRAPKILVAGCGTGLEAFLVRRRFEGARVLAVDLSRASLAYAIRRRNELGIGDITFAQADILGLEGTGRRFDMVFASGVLHHMADPIAGWRVLRSLLAPNGLMRIALYSARARGEITRIRNFVAARGYKPSRDGIAAFRADLLNEPGFDLEAVLRLADFYALPECRDLFFHVQEHCFSLPEIEAAIAALDLSFLGFELPDPVVRATYSAQTPEDPSAVSLGSWDAFEARHPDTFKTMYQFWLSAA